MALLAPLALAVLVQAPPQDELLERAARAAGAERRALVAELAARGPEGAPALVRGFEDAPLSERRVRAAALRAIGGDAAAEAAARLARDPDRDVRADLVELLARAQPGSATLPARAAALAERARYDLDPALRQRARDALAALPDEAGLDELEQLVRVLPPPGRSGAARALAEAPGARDRVVRLVQRAFSAAAASARTGDALPEDVLARLLRNGYGRALAETPAGGASAADLAPFLVGARHPSPRVREAAARALDQMVARLVFLGRPERADQLLADLVARGADARTTWLRRGTFALRELRDPEAAVRAGSAIVGRSGTDRDEDELEWRWRGEMLRAYGELAAGRLEPAQAALERARAAAAAMRGLRFAPSSDRPATGPEAHVRLCQTEVASVLVRLAGGAEPGDPDVLEGARAAHAALLRGQLQAARAYPGRALLTSWDQPLLDDALAVSLVLRPDRGLPALPSERAIDLSFALYRALAAVARDELPGFPLDRPVPPRLSDPTIDPERRAALLDLFFRERRAVEERLARLDPADPQQELEWRRLQVRLARLEEEARREAEEGYPSLAQQRQPSEAGLRLAEGLRAEGRAAEARALVERMRDDLEGARERIGTLAIRLLAPEIDLSIGASLTDEGDGGAAERAMLRGLERLEELEAELTAAGFDTVPIRFERANALVSLAVNANVKLRDPAKAVGYFERAYAIRQDDFMRVLLACYRARAGRADEARAALAGAPASPAVYYNLACTHALLGDADAAVDFLLLDFRENHASPASLRRQQDWARDDPDLASLRSDPRFERLLGMPFGGYD